MSVGVRGAKTDIHGAAATAEVKPSYGFEWSGHEDLAIGHEMEMGKPLVVVVDVVVGVARAIEGNAGEGGPGVGVLVEGFQ